MKQLPPIYQSRTTEELKILEIKHKELLSANNSIVALIKRELKRRKKLEKAVDNNKS